MKNFLLLLIAVSIAGCAATPVRRAVPVVKPLRLADEPTVEKRSAELRSLLAPLPVRGLLFSPRAIMGSDIPLDVVFSCVRDLGFNCLYARITSEEELDEPLRAFLDAAGHFEIPVELMLSQRDFFARGGGNRLLRKVRSRTPDLFEAVTLAARFSAELPPERRPAGITVIVEPHRMTAGSTTLPPGAMFAWSEKTYGPGLDNDLIMHRTFDMLRRLPAAAQGLPVSVAVPDFLHEKAVAGELSIGSIADFCAIEGIRRVFVINSGNRPSQLLSGVSDELKSAPKGAKVAIAVPVAEHFSVDAGALRRRDWKDFVRALGYLVRNASRHPSFEGVVVGPLASLVFILNEKD